MALPTLTTAAFAIHVLVAGALHRNEHANHEASDETDARSWPSWPHFPRPSLWPWSNGRCGKDECGLLAGSNPPALEVNCTNGVKRMAPTALLVPGRGGTSGIYCGVPKIGTSFTFGVMANLGLSNGGERFKGYRNVKDIVDAGDASEITKLCEAYSFVIIRNPWDRIVSAYVDKVLTLDTVSYRMKFHEFMSKLDAANASFLNLHFRPASLECWTSGDHRQKYDKVIKLEDNLEGQLTSVFTKHLSIPEDEVRRAMDDANTHSSSSGKAAEYDKSTDSDLDRTTYYFQQSDPEIVRRVYHDDIDFGKYEWGS